MLVVRTDPRVDTWARNAHDVEREECTHELESTGKTRSQAIGVRVGLPGAGRGAFTCLRRGGTGKRVGVASPSTRPLSLRLAGVLMNRIVATLVAGLIMSPGCTEPVGSPSASSPDAGSSESDGVVPVSEFPDDIRDNTDRQNWLEHELELFQNDTPTAFASAIQTEVLDRLSLEDRAVIVQLDADELTEQDFIDRPELVRLVEYSMDFAATHPESPWRAEAGASNNNAIVAWGVAAVVALAIAFLWPQALAAVAIGIVVGLVVSAVAKADDTLGTCARSQDGVTQRFYCDPGFECAEVRHTQLNRETGEVREIQDAGCVPEGHKVCAGLTQRSGWPLATAILCEDSDECVFIEETFEGANGDSRTARTPLCRPPDATVECDGGSFYCLEGEMCAPVGRACVDVEVQTCELDDRSWVCPGDVTCSNTADDCIRFFDCSDELMARTCDYRCRVERSDRQVPDDSGALMHPDDEETKFPNLGARVEALGEHVGFDCNPP